MGKERYLSLDIFKSLGIIYVIALHQIIWLYLAGDGDLTGLRYPEAYGLAYFISCGSGLHLLGLQLPLLAGTTFYFILQNKSLSFLDVLQRALFLMLAGFIMNALAWGLTDGFEWDDIFDWDVLQFVGLSMIIMYPFAKKISSKKVFLPLSIFCVFVLFYSNQFPFAQFSDHYLYSIIIGDLQGENYWPLCPWIVLFASGMYLGNVLRINEWSRFRVCMLSGFILMIISLVSGHFLPEANVQNAWGPNLFKPPMTFVFGIIGFCIFTIPFLHSFLEKNTGVKQRIINSSFLSFGQAILWIYIIHTIIGFNLTRYVINTFSFNYQSSLGVLFLLLMINLIIAFIIGKIYQKRKSVQYL